MHTGVWKRCARGMGAVLMCTWALAVQAQSAAVFPPSVMPGTPEWRASLPPMPHEQHPGNWPQPDYFTKALALTSFKSSARVQGVAVPSAVPAGTAYMALPVQTQAFGFSRVFAAQIGAELDWLVAASGVPATGQTEVVDAYGPFARRLDEGAIERLARQYPKQKLLALYLGHDGVNHAFVSLVAQGADGKRVAHKTVDLSSEQDKALESLVAALPELLRQVGVVGRAPQAARARGACEARVWALADLPADASVVQQACHALAIGTLLPIYGAELAGVDQQQSPAKLAWLAKALVWSRRGLEPVGSGAAIRDLALRQLAPGSTAPTITPYVRLADPVGSSLARLLSLSERTSKAPVRSQDDARDQEALRLQAALPAFASAVMRARTDVEEPFSTVDFCVIERRFPGGMPSAKCRAEQAPGEVAPARSATQAEKQLYQDWRIAASYKEFDYYASVQGRQDAAREVWKRLPLDVAEHPFLQRAKYLFEQGNKPQGSYDVLLKHERAMVHDFVQTTVNYQHNERWYDGYSLTEHGWTDNFNVMNDQAVAATTSAERRLLVVMRFDRFVPGQQAGMRIRKPGDPAFFLAPSMNDVMLGAEPGGLEVTPVPPTTVKAGASSPPMAVLATPPLFSPHMPFMEEVSKAELQKRVAADPQSLEWRTELALSMLKDGASLADALKVVDERPLSQRVDDRVGESHAWAYPAHAFYFIGEPDVAKKYYERVRRIGSGSDSDLLARVRVPQIEGRIPDALVASQTRLRRYDGEFAWFDTVSFLLLTGQADQAWSLFTERAASAKYWPVWTAPMAGHRLQGLDLKGIQDWLNRKQLDKVQIDRQDVTRRYLHMQAVIDRLPSDADIALLRERQGQYSYVPSQWGSSARLRQAALRGEGFKAAYDEVVAKAQWGEQSRNDFMLPIYTWVAWQATGGKDRNLDQVRQATTGWGFDNILAKSMLLALEGQTEASLHFFRAARIEQAQLGLGDDGLIQRPIAASYDYALAGYLMYKKTGVPAYRDETLRFVRAYQRSWPQSAWLFAMQAVLETDKQQKWAAACRARALDARSYFLSQAGVDLKEGRACPARLW